MKMPNLNRVKFEIYSCPNFWVEGELNGPRLFLHLTRRPKKFSLSEYKEMLVAMADIKSAAHLQGYEALYVLAPVELVKFERMLGFSVIESFGPPDGEPKFVLLSQRTF